MAVLLQYVDAVLHRAVEAFGELAVQIAGLSNFQAWDSSCGNGGGAEGESDDGVCVHGEMWRLIWIRFRYGCCWCGGK
ncbi:hypothetical protein HBH75_231320 [Parastagonospora nodorum]|nr:hypothetical protein HBH75_231320 [Parastagonospora nodorum]